MGFLRTHFVAGACTYLRLSWALRVDSSSLHEKFEIPLSRSLENARKTENAPSSPTLDLRDSKPSLDVWDDSTLLEEFQKWWFETGLDVFGKKVENCLNAWKERGGWNSMRMPLKYNLSKEVDLGKKSWAKRCCTSMFECLRDGGELLLPG